MSPSAGGRIVIAYVLLASLQKTGAICSVSSDKLQLSDWRGTIETPNFETSQYPPDQDCTWHINLSRGSRVRVVFDRFDLDPGEPVPGNGAKKCQEYVKVFDGALAVGQPMGTFCGGTIPPPLVTKTNQVTMVFVSDSAGGRKGFHLNYSGSCENINVTESGSVVESPNYPRPPPDDVRCEWWVTAPDTMYPLVSVPDFQTKAVKCNDAVINLYSSLDETNWICKDRKDPVKFNGNKMVIQYSKKEFGSPATFSLNLTFIEKCTGNVCGNGGTCEEEMFGIACKCLPKFHGKRCEREMFTCADNPCKNQAECIETDDQIVCECTPGFAGTTCDVRINECAPNPCLHGGTCVDKLIDYSCTCPEDFAGRNCENPMSECQNKPCMNGGTCQDYRNGFICLCPDGFTGETCQDGLSTCDPDTCINGVCRMTPDGTMCECKKGFSGDQCEINIDDCEEDPCNNGATCVDKEDGYRCLCPPGYTGHRCFSDIMECSEQPCKNNGTCVNLVPGFRCNCPFGFGGELCEVDINDCEANPCGGGGKCIDRPGGFECDCPPGRSGKTCETDANPCFSNPCRNDAPCVATTSASGSAYICECPLGYDGDQCQTEINECLPDPCQNGGVCEDKLNDFVCHCPPGFRGKVCSVRVGSCSSTPCKNNAECIDKRNGYECVCKPGYSGPFCGKVIRTCAENPCHNNGTCSDAKGSYQCKCLPGFEGITCETNINDCVENICMRGGVCVDLVNGFQCECTTNFGGKRCEEFLFEDSAHCKDEMDNNGISWFSTRAGSDETVPCPPGILGQATRICRANDQSETRASWESADLRNCVSPRLVALSKEAQGLLTAKYVTDRQLAQLTVKVVNATSWKDGTQLYPGDFIAAAETLGALAIAVEKLAISGQGIRQIAQMYGDAVENIIAPKTRAVWSKVKDMSFVEEKVTDVLDSVELLSENIAAKLAISYKRRKRGLYDTIEDSTVSVRKESFEFQIKLNHAHGSQSLSFYKGQTGSSWIKLPQSLLAQVESTSDGTYGVYNGKFSSLSELLRPRQSPANWTANSTESGVLNSDIIAAKVLGIPDMTFDDLQEPVVITFELKNPSLAQLSTPFCSFLNNSARLAAARWPRVGCEIHELNFSHVVCHCNHLTNFAILMDVYGTAGRLDVAHKKALSFISYIGGTLSILGCILAIIVFEYFRLKSDRVRIHEQLAISIVLVQFIFLVGIDRKENVHVCKVFAVLLHYSLLAMFCWMLVEGIHLYVILVKVFKKGSHLKKYMGLGWGVPLVIVAVSVGVFYDDYGEGEMCWMTNFMLLVLFVPIATVVILLNVFVLVVVVRVMMKSFAISGKTNSEEASSLRITLKAAAVLLPLLGLTWSFCFLSFDTKATLLFTYLFTLFNCLQGVLFFVFHCLLNIDVRKAYERRYKRPKQTSVNNPNGERNIASRRKSSLINTDSDPFVDTGPYNGSSLSYRSSTKSDDTEFSDLSYYCKPSSGGGQCQINNLSSTVNDNYFRPDRNTAESNLSNLPT